jgi:hypothetical protein
MENIQSKLLANLANKLRNEHKTRAQVVTSLRSAKIIDKDENFTAHYKNLGKIVTHR